METKPLTSHKSTEWKKLNEWADKFVELVRFMSDAERKLTADKFLKLLNDITK